MSALATPVQTDHMTAAEARHCVDAVKRHMRSSWELLLDIRDREGWRALGYDSWRACVVAEFHQSQSYLYYQMQAAETARAISTMVETENIPERHLRELAPLRHDPDALREVAASIDFTHARAADVRDAVREYRQPEVIDPPRPLASHQILNLSTNNEWYTPASYVDAARELMGGIDTDPASNPFANETIRAAVFYTKDMDGLSKPWAGRVWLNPPYGHDESNTSNQNIWSSRLVEQFEAGITEQAVLLVNAVTDRTWFQPLFRFPICFTDHRIRFYNADKPDGGQPTIGNALIYLGPDVERFIDIFSRFGTICPQGIRRVPR